VVRLVAGVAGAFLGPALLGQRPRTVHSVSTRQEGRVLVGILMAVTAAGPVVAGLAPHAVGPLVVLRYLFTDVRLMDPAAMQAICTDPGQQRECQATHCS
jgi:phosphatidylglycerol lysyltransferase